MLPLRGAAEGAGVLERGIQFATQDRVGTAVAEMLRRANHLPLAVSSPSETSALRATRMLGCPAMEPGAAVTDEYGGPCRRLNNGAAGHRAPESSSRCTVEGPQVGQNGEDASVVVGLFE